MVMHFLHHYVTIQTSNDQATIDSSYIQVDNCIAIDASYYHMLLAMNMIEVPKDDEGNNMYTMTYESDVRDAMLQALPSYLLTEVEEDEDDGEVGGSKV